MWPFKSKKYPLKHMKLEDLDQIALFAYANVAGVELVDDALGDKIAPHGQNRHPEDF